MLEIVCPNFLWRGEKGGSWHPTATIIIMKYHVKESNHLLYLLIRIHIVKIFSVGRSTKRTPETFDAPALVTIVTETLSLRQR